MGLSDPEDVIPGLIIVVAILGLIGALVEYIPAINDVPVLNFIAPPVHTGFTWLANLLTAYIPLEATVIAVLIELLIVIISIIIIVKVGY